MVFLLDPASWKIPINLFFTSVPAFFNPLASVVHQKIMYT